MIGVTNERYDSSVVARSLFSGIAEFVKLTSPMNQVNKFRNPVFVFHARDDSNVPFADAEKFVSQMKAAGKALHLNRCLQEIIISR